MATTEIHSSGSLREAAGSIVKTAGTRNKGSKLDKEIENFRQSLLKKFNGNYDKEVRRVIAQVRKIINKRK